MSINQERQPKIAVLGIGNLLMSDEGFGVHMVQELQSSWTFSPEIQLIDGGTAGMELLGFMSDFDHLLLIDAIDAGLEEASLCSFNHDEVDKYFAAQVSAHEVGIQDVLFIKNLGDNPLVACHVVGIQPSSLEPHIGLSDKVAAKKDEALKLCLDVLESWGVRYERRKQD